MFDENSVFCSFTERHCQRFCIREVDTASNLVGDILPRCEEINNGWDVNVLFEQSHMVHYNRHVLSL